MPERARCVSGAVAGALGRFSGDGWLCGCRPQETCRSLDFPSGGKEVTSYSALLVLSGGRIVKWSLHWLALAFRLIRRPHKKPLYSCAITGILGDEYPGAGTPPGWW